MSERVLAVAHRAANESGLLVEAVAAGAAIVEADVWPYRGRLEVRHLKTMGPVPLLWDRWKLVPAWAPRLMLEELLEQLPGDVSLMVDVKGRDREGAKRMAEVTAPLGAEGRLWACARDWPMLDPFEGNGAVAVHSAGTRGEAERLGPLLESGHCTAISIHEKLLDAEVVGRFRAKAHTLMTWPVNNEARMRELVGWGVNAITTDSLDVVRAIRRLNATSS